MFQYSLSVLSFPGVAGMSSSSFPVPSFLLGEWLVILSPSTAAHRCVDSLYCFPCFCFRNFRSDFYFLLSGWFRLGSFPVFPEFGVASQSHLLVPLLVYYHFISLVCVVMWFIIIISSGVFG